MAARGEEDVFKKRFPLEEEAEMLSEEAGGLEKKRQECLDKGMVEFEGWRDKIEELYPNLLESGLNPMGVVMQVAKATCLVVRKRGSRIRYQYHRKMASDASLSAEDRQIHHNMAEKCFSTPACGTGSLLYAQFFTACIIVNNHVIMEEEEAKDAEVYFDYDKDGQLSEAKKFKIRRFMHGTPRTDHAEDIDLQKLDYSILELKIEDREEFQFLTDHAFVKNAIDDIFQEVGFTVEESMRLRFTHSPHVMISHPRGLGKRLSCGEVSESDTHIKHTLGTSPGSSGGALVVFGKTDDSGGFGSYQGLHYRHQRAVAWGQIRYNLLFDHSFGHLATGTCNSSGWQKEFETARQNWGQVGLRYNILDGAFAKLIQTWDIQGMPGFSLSPPS